MRTASSRARAAARTMIRFETFAVAIAISRPIENRNSAITTQKPSPPVSSRIGTSRTFQPPLVSGIFVRQRVADRRHFGGGLIERDAVAQPADEAQVPDVARAVGIQLQWQPEIDLGDVAELDVRLTARRRR